MAVKKLNVTEVVAITIMGVVVLVISAVFLWIVGDLAWQGSQELSWEFFSSEPLDAGREGGILPIFVSTFLILLVCLGVTIPLAVGTAIFLTEFVKPDSWFGQLTGISLDILAGAPSIVFGLFGNVFFTQILGLGFSILAGGLTLACMVLPILIRSTQEGLKSVSDDYRQAGAALGLSRMALLKQILLAATMPGIAAGLLLGIGRAIAETAALMFTSGYVTRMPNSVFDSGRSLSIHIYDLAMNVPGGEGKAYATALVLVMLLIVINVAVFTFAMKFRRSWLSGI
ncbi:phosphate ABC transporter permease PstA [Euhalothece natronophila Z-M001]|uniref:Phosphate transport system permease protein PstA n=1 Tax=Euhalothece natronophila Z-M001 TaxID=522448 RepID=A0A5B8NQ55_9CHRO|nr:phosphate ABC transporter permease PstA [Euhalothece natronophila]QDZ41158.1 phosphate ABC transporter permease PstA [Euhalothece natronophila Z-M001]